MRVEDLISPHQFQLKCLFIACLIYHCGNFIVKVGKRCESLSRQNLFRVEAFLDEGARDFLWILKGILCLPSVYLPDPIESKGSVKTTMDMCLWVMELSGSVTSHLLDFNLRVFNSCWLLITLKNTCRHWICVVHRRLSPWDGKRIVPSIIIVCF